MMQGKSDNQGEVEKGEKNNNSFRVNVWWDDYRKLVSVDVQSFDNIKNVKNNIQGEIGAQNMQMQLFFRGMILESGRTLSDYNIQHDYMLHIVAGPAKELDSGYAVQAAYKTV